MIRKILFTTFVFAFIAQIATAQTGNPLLPNAHPFSYRLLYGLVDSKGNVLAEPAYRDIQWFGRPDLKYFLFRNNENKKGVMNQEGKLVIEPREKEPFVVGSYGAYYDNEREMLGLHLIDLDKGKEIFTHDSLRLWDVVKAQPPVITLFNASTNRSGLVTADGRFIHNGKGSIDIYISHRVCPLFWGKPMPTPDNASPRVRFVDCTGKEMTIEEYKLKYDENDLAKDALYTLFPEKKTTNKDFPEIRPLTIIPSFSEHPAFETFNQRLDGLAVSGIIENGDQPFAIVMKTDSSLKYGLINVKGEMIIPVEYDEISAKEAWLQVRNGAHRGVMTTEGKIILPIKFFKIDYFNSSNNKLPYYFEVTTHFMGYKGFASLDGQIFLPPEALNY